MSTSNPNGTGAGGPFTRAQRAAAGGTNPTPPPVADPSNPVLRPFSSSPLTVISPDSAENDEKHLLYDSDATESEAELPRLSSRSEFDRVRLQEEQLDARLKEMELLVMR